VRPRFAADEDGQALVVIAAAMAGLILGVGLALDTGQLFVSRRTAQTAADAAAWAGATVLYAGGSAAQARTAAATDATRNGYTDGGGVTVTTASPPASGTYTGDPGYVEVTITEQVATKFIPGASGGLTNVSVRAVAGIGRSGSGEAVIVTHGTASGALTLSGSTRFTITGGGTSTNSTSATAISIGAGGQLTGTFHRVTGSVSGTVAGRMSPAPITGAPATPDPFATVNGPSTAGLPLFGGQTITAATVTLSPGVYSGLVTVGNAGIARLNAGVYVFQAGFRSTGTGSIVLASTGGVLLYNTYSNYPLAPGGSPSCGAFQLNGSGAHTLAASATGSYAGMLFFQDRNCTTGSQITVRANTSLSGTQYIPAATHTIAVSASQTIASQIIANRLTLNGNNTLTMNFTPASVTGTRVPSLVE
jgi:hypothetical protein